MCMHINWDDDWHSFDCVHLNCGRLLIELCWWEIRINAPRLRSHISFSLSLSFVHCIRQLFNIKRNKTELNTCNNNNNITQRIYIVANALRLVNVNDVDGRRTGPGDRQQQTHNIVRMVEIHCMQLYVCVLCI